jgi:hypothetical protein
MSRPAIITPDDANAAFAALWRDAEQVELSERRNIFFERLGEIVPQIGKQFAVDKAQQIGEALGLVDENFQHELAGVFTKPHVNGFNAPLIAVERSADDPPLPLSEDEYGSLAIVPAGVPDIKSAVLALADWIARKLPEPVYLLGSWLTTTSRTLLVAETGLGKTNFGIALAMAVAAGAPFLHWGARRPCRGLYIDGEMSSRLFKERLEDGVARLGEVPAGFFALSHEDIEGFAPLNTPAGQACVEKIIEKIGGVDFIVFDSIMCLVAGDMKDEEPWQQALPWIRSLTKRSIGQLWIHHTGHDATRSYGTKTREWQLDTVMHLNAVEREDTDVSFSLEFKKARERTPATRADFQTTRIALVGDVWKSEATASARKGRVSPLGQKFLLALQNALAEGGKPRNGRPCVSIELWRGECVRMGLIDAGNPPNARSLFSKHRRELIGENHVVCDNDFAWLVR